MNHSRETVSIRFSLDNEDVGLEEIYLLLRQSKDSLEKRRIMKGLLLELVNLRHFARSQTRAPLTALENHSHHNPLPKPEEKNPSASNTPPQWKSPGDLESAPGKTGGFLFTGSRMYKRDELY